MNNRKLLISAAIAGTVMAVLSNVPVIQLVNCLLCGWIWLGGIFAVWLYRRNSMEMVDAGRGAMIGALAGLVAAVVGAILSLILAPINAANSAAIMQQMQEQFGQTGTPMPDVTGIGTAVGILFLFVLYPLFGAIGGAIGSAIFKGRPGPAV